MQDVMNLNLVDEGGSELVAGGMYRHRDQRLGLVAHRFILQDEVLSGQFALSGHVVP